MSWDYATKLEQQLREEVAALLARAEQADEAEPDVGLDIPEELKRRRDRLEAIASAKEEITQRAAERHRAEMAARAAKEAAFGRKPGGRPPQEPQPGPHPKDQVNFTDPESRIMPPSEGFVQGFNAQAAVDNGSHLIAAGHATDACNDKQQIAPALEQLAAVEAVIGKPEGILADTGYFSADNVAQCEMAEVTPFIASGLRPRRAQPAAGEPAGPGAGAYCQCGPGGESNTSPEDAGGQGDPCPAQGDRGDGIPDHQGGDGIPAFSSAETERGKWGMDADQPGLEPETDARSRKLSKKRKNALTGPERLPARGPKRPLGAREAPRDRTALEIALP